LKLTGQVCQVCRHGENLPGLPAGARFAAAPELARLAARRSLAYFVSDVVDQLDLSVIESVYEEEERGQPPYHPQMMTKIVLYGYCVGVFSSRRIEKRLREDGGFRMLAAGNEPDFRTISDFRKLHLAALQGLFDQLLQCNVPRYSPSIFSNSGPRSVAGFSDSEMGAPRIETSILS
jgi:Transposase domain (DUF772)